MKKLIALFASLFVFCELFSQKIILMEEDGGVYRISCSVNGAKMKMVFDTGASNVSLSMSIAKYLIDNNFIKKEDIIGKGRALIADGSSVETYRLILRDIEIDGLHLYNVEAMISSSQDAPLLLGQSAIQKLGKISIEGNRLIINSAKTNISAEEIEKLRKEIDDAAKQQKEFIAVEKLEKLKSVVEFTEEDYRRLTGMYFLIGKYRESISTGLEYLNKGIVEKEQNVGIICKSLGFAYYELKDFAKAAEYFKRALEYKFEDNVDYEYLYDDIGNSYTAMQQYDKAYYFYKKGLDMSMARIGCTSKDIDKGMVQDEQLGATLYRIGNIYHLKGQYNTANNWLKASAQCGYEKAQQQCIQYGIKYKVKKKK